MKKILFVAVLLGTFLLGVTGCGNKVEEEEYKIKEEKLLGLKYVDSADTEEEYISHWEFREANVLYSYDINCGSSSTCNTNNSIYEIDEDGILVITHGSFVSKWKISEDWSTITGIGSDTVMTKID